MHINYESTTNSIAYLIIGQVLDYIIATVLSIEIANVSVLTNKIANVSAMWCNVARDCQCVSNVGNVRDVPNMLTLSKDILKDIVSKSHSGVETCTPDGKIEFNPNYKFATTAALESLH